MSDFSPSDAAFEGFKIPREHPYAVLVWALLHFLISAGVTVTLILVGGDTLADIQAMLRAPPDPATAMQTMREVAPVYAVVLFFALIVQSVFSAAVYRIVMRSEQRGFFWLRLGMDELRLGVLAVIQIGVLSILAFAVVFALGLVVSVFALMAPVIAAIASGPLVIIAVLVMIYVWVRLSLAGPQTFFERKLHIFQSWEMTKAHVWPLMAAYVLAAIMALIVYLLSYAVITGCWLAINGGDFARAVRTIETAQTSIPAFLTVASLVFLAFSSLLKALWYILMPWMVPAAVAYRHYHL